MAESSDTLKIKQHQFKRLVELRDHCFNENATAFGRAIGVADTYAVRMFWPIGTQGRKGLGNAMQAKIRETLQLPPGWFDLPLGTALPGSQQAPVSSAEPNEVDALIATIRRSSGEGTLSPQVAEQMRHMIEAMGKKG